MYKDCKFALEKERESCARIQIFKQGILNSYTLEASMFGADSKYKGKDKSYDLHLTAEDFVDVGRDFCKSIFNANTSTIL